MSDKLTAVVRYHGEGKFPTLAVATIQSGDKPLQSMEFHVNEFETTEELIDAILGYFLDFGVKNLSQDIFQYYELFPLDYRPDLLVLVN